MRIRTALTGLAALAASAAVLAPLQAQAVTESHVRDLLIRSSADADDQWATASATAKGGKDGKLPFHSWMSAELHHCDGTVTHQIGWVAATQDDTKPWRTSTGVDLGFDAAAGPYEKWVVNLHSKGRKTSTTTVTKTEAFSLGCSGEFTASEFLEPTTAILAKPLTANYKVSAKKALATRARFGTLSGLDKGRAVAGKKVSMKGAGALVKGKVRAKNCETAVDILFPGRPGLVAATARDCAKPVQLPKRITFWDNKGKGHKHSIVGKRVYVGTQITIKGHTYAKYSDLGKVVKK